VTSGVRDAEEAERAMTEIVHHAQKVDGLIGTISTATAEQSTGIGQVNAAVSQLEEMTQRNAALVEQSAAAAESLKQRAIRVAEAIDVFSH
jgi:methyl-accepting chemotaxis protein